MKTILAVALLIVGLAKLTSSQATIQETICGRFDHSCSFYGKPAVSVMVEDVADPLKRTGLSKQQLKTEVELLLRKFDIPLVKSGSLPTSSDITLYFTVAGDDLAYAGGRKAGAYYYNVECQSSQRVRLVRNPSIKVVNAITWELSGTLGLVSKNAKTTITNVVKDNTKAFINVYLEANPK